MGATRGCRWLRVCCGLALVPAVAGASAPTVTWGIEDPGQGPVALPAEPAGLTELSGITWLEGSAYLAVSDTGGNLFALEVPIDPATGFITSVAATGPLPLAGGVDLEGVAYDALSGEVLASDEVGPAIRIHDPEDGAELDTVPVPGVYLQIRSNFGLESLSLGPRVPFGRTLYTANEEALSVDGPISTFEEGTLVRIQRFDEASPPSLSSSGGLDPQLWMPASQWAYLTDSIGGSPTAGQRSGVVELMHLPDAGVLVLERSFGAGVGVRSRIYAIETAGATETSSIASFEQTAPTPLAKTLLFEGDDPLDNFEGIALGPQLANGDYALLLVSDDAGGSFFQGSVMSLRLVQVPEVGSAPLALVLASLLARSRTRRREP